VLAFLFVLGVLVFVHELGHFVVARHYGVRCPTFSIGFGPKLIQFQRGDTVYCISAIPLGGYVKMAGETAEEQIEAKDDEFLSKTKWQRFQILLAGPAMNIILSVVVMTVVLYQGAQVPVFEDQPPIVGTVGEGSPAEKGGIQPGDLILNVAGRTVDTWEALSYAVAPRADREIEVVLRRSTGVQTLRVTPVGQTEYNLGDIGIGPDISPQVLSVSSEETSAARQAGIKVGDVIEAIEGIDVTMASLIETINKSADAALTLRIRRDGVSQDIEVTPRLQGDVAVIGVGLSPYEVETIEPSPFEAIQLSFEQNYEWSGLIFGTLKELLTFSTSPKQLVGPVGIMQLSGQAAQLGWGALFGLMSMISINLAIINLLPIPVLDGGHIFVMAMEGVSRRDFSVRLKERMMFAGLVVIATLMVTVIYNDLTRVEWIERLMLWR
jgi:regulator of sigma E protease